MRKGQVLPPNLAWQGYGAGATDTTTLDIHDLFDCDGSKGINAIIFDTSATWCGACQQEASSLESAIKSSLGANGAAFITLMGEDAAQGSKPTMATALNWRNQFHLADVTVVADPARVFYQTKGLGGSIGLPFNVLVDPRTMTVVKFVEGYSGPWSADPDFQKLVAQNTPQ
jgi:hypothetical protein